jgi:hypothetical protein
MHSDGVAELIRAADESARRGFLYGGLENVRNEAFIGRRFESWTDCVRKALQPWPEGMKRIRRLLSEVGDARLSGPVSRKRRLRYDETGGDEIEPDRLYGGDPSYWRAARRQFVPGPQAVSLFTNVATWKGRPSHAVFWRGAAAITLTNLLEDAGFDVELIAVNKSRKTFGKANRLGKWRWQDDWFASVVLKGAGRRLDESVVVNALSGWFYRTVWFQAHYCVRPNEVSPHLGKPSTIDDRDPEIRELARGSRIVTIDSVFGKEAALDLIRRKVAEVNSGVW